MLKLRVNRPICLRLVIVSFLFFLCYPGYPYVLQNGSGKGYCETATESDCVEVARVSETATIMSSPETIEYLVINGGRHFLNSHANYLLLLEKIEASSIDGIDFYQLEKLLDNSLEQIQLARDTYRKLIEKAEVTPYNPSFIKNLEDFDYDAHKLENNLNGTIFSNVCFFLKEGNITGAYGFSYSNFFEIEKALNNLRVSIAINKIPQIEELWKINENYSDALLFGQYAARVYMSQNH